MKMIGVTELQRRFKSVFDEVAYDHVPYVLMRGSRPEAALIAYDEYQRFQEWQEQEVLTRFDRVVARLAEENARYGDDEIAADVEAVRAELPC